MNRRSFALPTLSLLLALGGCASDGDSGAASGPAQPKASASAPAPGTAGGRYAMSGDAYPESPPDVSQVPDATPRVEARSSAGNRSTYEVWGKTYHVLDDATGYSHEGTASWYGNKFHGYATSNGEIYDMYKMSAAHKTLPLPTYAQVTNLDNGRSVIVRVNDRGPFHDDREIDLSYAAASRLDILDHGTGRVRVTAIDPQQWLAQHSGGSGTQVARAAPAAAPVTKNSAVGTSTAAPRDSPASAPSAPAASTGGEDLFVQVAALGSQDGARTLQKDLQRRLERNVRVASEAGMYKVQVGPLPDRNQIEPLRQALAQAGYPQTFVVGDR
uniref:septal ring lytic transglycosylase RlpA family protein n=1 Tax=Halomonas sp. TaxID=1486246 RepID=UPI00260F4697|nr:septal ring lytic transglycosylase RlpA family protein [Halomonas sp.]